MQLKSYNKKVKVSGSIKCLMKGYEYDGSKKIGKVIEGH